MANSNFLSESVHNIMDNLDWEYVVKHWNDHYISSSSDNSIGYYGTNYNNADDGLTSGHFALSDASTMLSLL